jgi:hypothetical protein
VRADRKVLQLLRRVRAGRGDEEHGDRGRGVRHELREVHGRRRHAGDAHHFAHVELEGALETVRPQDLQHQQAVEGVGDLRREVQLTPEGE